MCDKATQQTLVDISNVFADALNNTIPADLKDPACDTKQRSELREELEDDSDIIEQVIIDNADLIQDYRFKYINKKKAGRDVEILLAEFGCKILDMIDRKLDDLV